MALLVRFAEHWTGDDPAGLPLMLTALLLYVAANSGILGLLFQAAMSPRQPLSFLQWTAGLFLPVFWLLFKIGLLQAWLIALAATAHHLISGAGLPESLEAVIYWGRPLFDLVTQILALYSIPVCILARVRREWRPAIRQGIKMYFSSPTESSRLLLLIFAVTIIESLLHFSLGRTSGKTPPGYAEGVVSLLGAYLTLAAFFGASRLVLARLTAGPREIVTADTAAPGPHA